jgi:hypothetical protein
MGQGRAVVGMGGERRSKEETERVCMSEGNTTTDVRGSRQVLRNGEELCCDVEPASRSISPMQGGRMGTHKVNSPVVDGRDK